jgi:hypothetical protein
MTQGIEEDPTSGNWGQSPILEMSKVMALPI